MNAPFNPSPAEARIDQMRQDGTCVTSPKFKAAQAGTKLPVLPRKKLVLGSADIPEPKHESMHDG